MQTDDAPPHPSSPAPRGAGSPGGSLLAVDDMLPPELAAAMDRLAYLVEKFEQYPDVAVQERACELPRFADVVQRVGLRVMAQLLRETGLVGRALDAPAIRLLFDLYDLHDDGERARVEAVLVAVRPYLESQGADVDVVAAEAGVVKARLTVGGRPAPAATPLRWVVEGALREGLPDFVRLDVLESPRATGSASAPVAPTVGFIPLSQIQLRVPPKLVWHEALAVADIPPGEVRGVSVEGQSVLVVNLDGELRGYQNACPGTPLPLHGAQVEGTTLHCPWHHCRFDARSGERLDADGPGLKPVAVAASDGVVRIGLPRGGGR